MKLIAQVKLTLTPEERDLLLETLQRANEACNYLSDVAWETATCGKFALQKVTYHDAKKTFGLSAQVVVRCIAKVSDAYKLDRKTRHTFSPRGSIAYDSRILNYRLDSQTVSIWTLKGRIVVPFEAGDKQLALLHYQQGESDLVYRKDKGAFFLHAVCEVAETPQTDVEQLLGVDLGVVNIATDSDGETFSAEDVEQARQRYSQKRADLQRVGTPSAKRKLKRLSKREANFRKNTNHVISKRLVQKAQDTGRGIALEELSGIRTRITVRKS